MGLRAVFDVDVEDEKFRRFTELYNKYQESLAKTPGIWAKVGKEQAELVKVSQMMTASMMAQGEQMREIAGAQADQQRHLAASARLWTGIAGSAKSVAGYVLHATVSLARWAGIIGLGLVGGSLFGIDRMASDVGDQRRSSMGLGMSIGSMKAFGTDFGRVVDPSSFLGGVLQMRTNPAMSGALWALGVNPSGSETQVALATMNALRARARATPDSQLGLILQSLPGLQGVSVEDLERMKHMSGAEWNAQMAHFARDRGALNIAAPTALAWQNFATQMQRAGQTMFKVFVQGLAPLEKPLEGLSKSLVHVLTVLMSKDGIVEEGIKSLSKWLDDWNGKISKPQFIKDVESFVSSVGQLAHAVKSVVDFFVPNGGPHFNAGKGPIRFETGKQVPLWYRMLPENWGMMGTEVGVNKSSYSAYLAGTDKYFRLPAGALESIWRAESNDTFDPPDSSKGAIGPMQIMPKTALGLGVDPRNAESAAYGAGLLLWKYRREFGGSIAKALAAYNWGPTNVARDVAKYGGAWRGHLPAETRNYLSRTLPGIRIENATGGSAVVAANGLAQ